MIREKLPALITTKPVIYLVNMSDADFRRKKNKWLPKVEPLAHSLELPASINSCCGGPLVTWRVTAQVHKWIQEHGGGTMIPFSIQWEQKVRPDLWDG